MNYFYTHLAEEKSYKENVQDMLGGTKDSLEVLKIMSLKET